VTVGGKRIWVVGAGGIGSVVAGKLGPEHRCVLVDAWPAHVEAIREGGLRIDYPDGPVRLSVAAYLEEEVSEIPDGVDLVLLAVKANRTAECVSMLLPHISDHTTIVSLQNGVNEDLIARLVGPERAVGAVVDFAAELLGPGRARGHGLDYGILIGELDGAISPRVRELAELLDPAIPIQPTEDIWGALWSKLIVNVQLNPLCALSGLPTDQLAADPPLRRLSLALAIEAVRVATRLGVALDPSFLDGELEAYLDGAAEAGAMSDLERNFLDRWSGESFRPSMLQDVEKGRPTEIEALNGYVVQKGRSAGVPVPVNEAVVELVKGLRLQARGSRAPEIAEALSRLHANLPA
jgi:2-dehydropantoate 2-reductase